MGPRNEWEFWPGHEFKARLVPADIVHEVRLIWRREKNRSLAPFLLGFMISVDELVLGSPSRDILYRRKDSIAR